MRQAQALALALSLCERPSAARTAQALPLPKGVTFVLEVAAGEAQAVSEAVKLTGRSENDLQRAAGFFIEQVLLTPTDDSYRILGSNREATFAELRRHMALIMKWLHPDLMFDQSLGNDLNRSVYAKRVTKAWEFIKAQRRENGADALQARKVVSTGRPESRPAIVRKRNPVALRRTEPFAVSGSGPADLLRRLLLMIGRR